MLKSSKNKPSVRLIQKLWLVVCIILISVIIFSAPCIKVLSVQSRKKNSEYVISKKAASDGFVISYTHSVNKGRIHDIYNEVESDKLRMDHTVFVSYGAGIIEPFEEEGLIFSDENDGFHIKGLNRIQKQFLLAVGTVADHTIILGQNYNSSEEIRLDSYFSPQTILVLEVKRISLLKYLKTNLSGRNLDKKIGGTNG